MVRRGRARPLRRRRHQGDPEALVAGRFADEPGRRGPARHAQDDQRRLRATTACRSSTRRAVPPAQGRARHRQRHGRRRRRGHLPAPAARDWSRCTSSSTAPSPTTRPTRSRRRTAARSWSAWSPEKADLGHRLGRRRRPLLLHRRHRRVRARRLRHRAAGRGLLPQGARAPSIVYDVRASRAVARPRGGGGRHGRS